MGTTVCYILVMRIVNAHRIPVAESFIRLYGEAMAERFPEVDAVVEILPLTDAENHYDDVLVRLGNRIYISERQTGALGLTVPELYAAIAHEFGHILYRTNPWAPDAEHRADTLAAELGLGSQMISVIEKVIQSRRFAHITSQLVRRIQYLTAMHRSEDRQADSSRRRRS